MKNLFAVIVLFLTFNAFAQSEIANTPEGACWDEECNQKQEQLLQEFLNVGVLPDKTPAVYSGVCNHNGMYNPDVDHYAVALLDNVKGNWNFSGIFAYFYEQNEYQNWDLSRARAEMSPYWGDYGNLSVAENTARSVIKDDEGKWVYIYWMRQNPVTKDLLLISYAGFVQKTFCRLKRH